MMMNVVREDRREIVRYLRMLLSVLKEAIHVDGRRECSSLQLDINRKNDYFLRLNLGPRPACILILRML